MAGRLRAGMLLGAALVIGAAILVALAQAMSLPLSHDEHQFVVSGRLLADQGLLPYRHFPFHHLPNLVLVYALLGGLIPGLLLNARLVSVVLGWSSMALLVLAAVRQASVQNRALGWAIGAGAAALLVLNPLFAYTSGRAWNHDLAVMLTLAAVLVHASGVGRSRIRRWMFLSGCLLGLAAGSRLSVLPALAPFLAYTLIVPEGSSGRERLQLAGAHLAGFVAGLLPALVLFALGPQGFVYGNLIYPQLNTQYREALHHLIAVGPISKLRYLWEDVLLDPAQLLLVSGSVILGLAAVPQLRRWRQHGAFWLSAAVASFLLLGSLVPTPSWYQYFYAPLPFLILSMIYTVSLLVGGSEPTRAYLVAVLIVLLGGTLFARLDALGQLARLSQPHAWEPVKVRALGREIRELVGGGKVLTLAPTIPLEGGLETYPEFSTGPFSWRISVLLSPGQRRAFGVLAPDDLEAFLAADPPAAILVGFERGDERFVRGDEARLEAPFEAHAQEHGYRMVVLANEVYPNELRLWIQGPALVIEPVEARGVAQ